MFLNSLRGRGDVVKIITLEGIPMDVKQRVDQAISSLKGLSSEIYVGSKMVSIDRSPFKLPTLCFGFLFYTAAILKFR